jgi:uncharacterized protein DUF4357
MSNPADPAPRRGRSIRLFLVDGTPTGLIVAEIGMWTGKAIVVPRGSLVSFLGRPEAQNAGIYILSGQDPDDPFRLRVYVGETEIVGKRLREHDKDEQKEFFERAIVFVSKDENLTKAHARHLEEHLTKRIKEAGRTTPMHHNQPPGAALPEADRSDMDFFLEQIAIVLPVLGLDVLRPIAPKPVGAASTASSEESPEFIFSIGEVHAKGIEVNNEFIVKADSVARNAEAPTLPKAYRTRRDQLKLDGSLKVRDPETLVFTRDVPFSSPSAAAYIVYGAKISGPAYWRVESSGETYGEFRQKSLKAAEASG